jgi:prefoldin subunit 5
VLCYNFAKFQDSIKQSPEFNVVESEATSNYLSNNSSARIYLVFLEKINNSDIVGAREIARRKENFGFIDKDSLLKSLDAILHVNDRLNEFLRNEKEINDNLNTFTERYHHYQNELRFVFRQKKVEEMPQMNQQEYKFYQSGVLQGMPMVESIPAYETLDDAARGSAVTKKQMSRFSADVKYVKWRAKGLEAEILHLLESKKGVERMREDFHKSEGGKIKALKDLVLQNMLEQFYQTTPHFFVSVYNIGMDVNNFLAGLAVKYGEKNPLKDVVSIQNMPKVNKPEQEK